MNKQEKKRAQEKAQGKDIDVESYSFTQAGIIQNHKIGGHNIYGNDL